MIVGERSREHALAQILRACRQVETIFVAPGNDHIADEFECIPADSSNICELLSIAKQRSIGLVIVADEELIAKGIREHFMTHGITVFGCSKRAARIESSKAFAKQVFAQCDVLSPRFVACERGLDALGALDQFSAPWVLKLDGFASGKGVVITDSRKKAEDILTLDDRFAHSPVVLEAYVRGREAGLSAIVHRGRLALCWEVWDYKRRYDGDRGSLTGGGMGAVIQWPRQTAILVPGLQRIVSAVGIESGFVNLNSIQTDDGSLFTTEVNIHAGTPECEALAVSQPEAIANSILGLSARWNQDTSVGVAVTLVTRGYPDQGPLSDIELGDFGDCSVFLNSVSKSGSGVRQRQGRGRVVTIAGAGPNVQLATSYTYNGLSGAGVLSGLEWRSDIGLRQPATFQDHEQLSASVSVAASG